MLVCFDLLMFMYGIELRCKNHILFLFQVKHFSILNETLLTELFLKS